MFFGFWIFLDSSASCRGERYCISTLRFKNNKKITNFIHLENFLTKKNVSFSEYPLRRIVPEVAKNVLFCQFVQNYVPAVELKGKTHFTGLRFLYKKSFLKQDNTSTQTVTASTNVISNLATQKLKRNERACSQSFVLENIFITYLGSSLHPTYNRNQIKNLKPFYYISRRPTLQYIYSPQTTLNINNIVNIQNTYTMYTMDTTLCSKDSKGHRSDLNISHLPQWLCKIPHDLPRYETESLIRLGRGAINLGVGSFNLTNIDLPSPRLRSRRLLPCKTFSKLIRSNPAMNVVNPFLMPGMSPPLTLCEKLMLKTSPKRILLRRYVSFKI